MFNDIATLLTYAIGERAQSYHSCRFHDIGKALYFLLIRVFF